MPWDPQRGCHAVIVGGWHQCTCFHKSGTRKDFFKRREAARHIGSQVNGYARFGAFKVGAVPFATTFNKHLRNVARARRGSAFLEVFLFRFQPKRGL